MIAPMQIILTHEQADFDAIGSLLGAALLDSTALPVLPRKQNRNVRSFLALYGGEFPFVEPRDLPEETIGAILLVDTQSLISLKGMGRRAAIRAIDHHTRRKSTPEEWDLTTLETGATTTYFVELLEARDERLSTIQATLLLLGIYEDTGSLTYGDTTARDIRAAAWLVDQGGNLELASDYLNPPLSAEQRSIYDVLVDSVTTHEVSGLRVAIGKAAAPGMVDEISALAHKLRDLLDPDALFILVQTDEGVRLVARSSTDRLDVAAVSGTFGGGGHARAASALISTRKSSRSRASPLDSVHARLLQLLPKHIRPALTVAQIMSKRPRTLGPHVSAEEASSLMRRYGYEGFPVVEDRRVIGLLTRRAVDRAVGHGLHLTAASLMEAGEVTVAPTDPVQRLQTVMLASGWGQIPVCDEAGRIVGIVTRTDLLKTLAPAPPASRKVSLRERLEKELPASQRALLRLVAGQAANMGLPVYIVGGFVRDLLLGRLSPDIDIVVEGDAISLAKALSRHHGGKVTSHARFGTAKWSLPASIAKKRDSVSGLPPFLDLITARLEFYEHPAALPGVEHGSIRHDLHRRDFTINTLALRLDGRHFGELYDHYGGQRDLENGVVRVLHSLSFLDDPTRMLRAIRYEQRYGFTIEARTRQLIDEARPLISRLSAERIRHELDLIFEEQKPGTMLARLHEVGLLASICDTLPWREDLSARLSLGLQTDPPEAWELSAPSATIPLRQALAYALWLEDLSTSEIALVQARLQFPAPTMKIIQAASILKTRIRSLAAEPPSVWTFVLDEYPRLAVYAVYLALSDDASRRALESYALTWRHLHATISGATLKQLGLPPGPRYQLILDRLRAAWLDGEIKSGAQEQALLEQLFTLENGAHPPRQ